MRKDAPIQFLIESNFGKKDFEKFCTSILVM